MLAGLAVPVRTKKSGFYPEWLKEPSPEQKERRLRALVRTFPEEHRERTFYLACTGDALLSA